MKALESIPKYVIESLDRRQSIIGEQLKTLNLEYISVPGTFFERYPENFDPKESWVKSKRRLSISEIGCANSHLNVYKSIIASDVAIALVFEDDCSITDFSILNEIIDNALKMNIEESFCITLHAKKATLKYSERYDTFLFSVIDIPSTTVCYLITRKAAEALSIANQNLNYVADWPKNSKVKFYLTKRIIVETNEENSIIAKNRGTTSISSFSRLIIMLSIFSGVHYLMYRKYFNDLQEYVSILIMPSVVRFRAIFFSKKLPSPKNNIRLLKN
jgi:glycosyl transferase family 25